MPAKLGLIRSHDLMDRFVLSNYEAGQPILPFLRLSQFPCGGQYVAFRPLCLLPVSSDSLARNLLTRC
jgi:hypothetical protein